MPHVVVKMYAGRSEDQKKRLAEAMTAAVVQVLGAKESSVSVAIEDFDPDQWAERVYRPDILEKAASLYKKPGYDPFAR